MWDTIETDTTITGTMEGLGVEGMVAVTITDVVHTHGELHHTGEGEAVVEIGDTQAKVNFHLYIFSILVCPLLKRFEGMQLFVKKSRWLNYLVTVITYCTNTTQLWFACVWILN